MENRIQVDGIWYVREDAVDTDRSWIDYINENSNTYPVDYLCTRFENSDWIFEANLHNDDFDSISIVIKNKKTGKYDVWDDASFIRNFDSHSFGYAEEVLDIEGTKLLYYFILSLKEKDWL